MKAIGTYRLILSTGFVLDLEDTFYVPSFSRNLILVSRLTCKEFHFSFENSSFNIIKDSVVIGTGSLYDGLYKLCLGHMIEQ